MAKLKKSVLGKVSGAVGDIVFRQRNGNNYIGVRPDSFTPGNDLASVERRARFALSVKLSAAINGNSILKNLWSNKTPSDLSLLNYLIKLNYSAVQPDNVTNLITFMPPGGFIATVDLSSVTNTLIQVSIDPIGNNAGIDTNIEINVQLAGLLYLSDPVDEGISPINFISLISSPVQLNLLNPLAFNVSLR